MALSLMLISQAAEGGSLMKNKANGGRGGRKTGVPSDTGLSLDPPPRAPTTPSFKEAEGVTRGRLPDPPAARPQKPVKTGKMMETLDLCTKWDQFILIFRIGVVQNIWNVLLLKIIMALCHQWIRLICYYFLYKFCKKWFVNVSIIPLKILIEINILHSSFIIIWTENIKWDDIGYII